MKIIRDNKIYIQKCDICNLLKCSNTLGIEIDDEIYNVVFIKRNLINNYEFVCFDGEKYINFFNKFDYIFDYDLINRRSIDDIKNMIHELSLKLDELSILEENIEKCDYICLKIFILSDILDFKVGNARLNLPCKKKKILAKYK